MAENTGISWATHTFNPWWGCTKVGPGCEHCYAETFDRRTGGDHWGAGVPRRLVKDWSGPRKWHRRFQEYGGERPWVFCASMSDVFDNEVPAAWRDRLWDIIRETYELRWILVTKRIGNAARMLPHDWRDAFKHCGLVATVCNQEEADRDIGKLLALPASWRGLSIEPMLGPVNLALGGHLDRWEPNRWKAKPAIEWVIVGGESGRDFRHMEMDWAVDLMGQCLLHETSFHFKQWAGSKPKNLGRLLLGAEHNGMPPSNGAWHLG